MFTQEQKNLLAAPLSKDNVRVNPRGYSYLEGWHAIAEANRIFGFDGWDRETVEMVQLGEPEIVQEKWRVAYRCRVRITVHTDGRVIMRDGTGYGSGIVKDVRDAHESAAKEAETDAMKRALMTFGNPFGLALYDKKQTNVADAPDESLLRFIKECDAKIDGFTDPKALRDWWASDEQKKARRAIGLSPLELDTLMLKIKLKLETLEGKAAA
jgi:DNA repair and recombination protein RAD52